MPGPTVSAVLLPAPAHPRSRIGDRINFRAWMEGNPTTEALEHTAATHPMVKDREFLPVFLEAPGLDASGRLLALRSFLENRQTSWWPFPEGESKSSVSASESRRISVLAVHWPFHLRTDFVPFARRITALPEGHSEIFWALLEDSVPQLQGRVSQEDGQKNVSHFLDVAQSL